MLSALSLVAQAGGYWKRSDISSLFCKFMRSPYSMTIEKVAFLLALVFHVPNRSLNASLFLSRQVVGGYDGIQVG